MKMTSLLGAIYNNYDSKLLLFVVIYLSFLLDNIFLTVVVPIIPDYLFSIEENGTIHQDSTNIPKVRSLSYLQRKFEMLERENGPLGALLASKSFVQLAFTPLVSWIIKKFGYSVALLLGSFNMLLASILFAYGTTFGILVVARSLHGFSSAAVAVSGMSLLATNVPSASRNQWMPIAFGGIALGVLIGYPLGGAAYQYLGKSAPFLLISFLIAVNIVLQMVLARSTFDRFNKDPTKEIPVRSLIRNPNIMVVIWAIFITTSTMALLEPCVPIWLLANLEPPPTRWQLGAVFIPDSVGYLLGSHFAGLMPISTWRTAFVSMVICGLSCCILPLSPTLDILAVPHFFIGLSVGATDAALQVATSLAYAIAPLLGGQSVHLLGFAWTLRTMGFLNLVFCPLLLQLEAPIIEKIVDLEPDNDIDRIKDNQYTCLENDIELS